MEVRILEVRLAGGTKAVWRFSGEAACCCLELIEKVVIPEMRVTTFLFYPIFV